MILDWLIRHSQKETEKMSLEELQPELQPEPQPEPQVDPQPETQPEPEKKPEPQPEAEQAVVNDPTPAEPKVEDEQSEQQSKLVDALDALTVDKGQLATASSITAKDGNAALALTSLGALKIEAPLHEQGFAQPELAPSPDGEHSHNIAPALLGQHTHSFSPSLYTYALATASAVDKLEAAYKNRILHIRSIIDHLGKEAEADVLALFDKHPIAID